MEFILYARDIATIEELYVKCPVFKGSYVKEISYRVESKSTGPDNEEPITITWDEDSTALILNLETLEELEKIYDSIGGDISITGLGELMNLQKLNKMWRFN